MELFPLLDRTRKQVHAIGSAIRAARKAKVKHFVAPAPGPSVFDKTPEEHLRDAEERLRRDRKGKQAFVTPVPPNHVRVQFYSELGKVQQGLRPDLTADVPMEPCGGLDLRRVCKLWGLERCTPVDPMRWILFEPGDPNWLSDVAVKVLSEVDNCIKFIEPTVSSATRYKRAARQSFLMATVAIISSMCFIFISTLQKSANAANRLLEEHTRLPQKYRSSWRERKRFQHKIDAWMEVVDLYWDTLEFDWREVATFLAGCFFVGLCVLYACGWFELALQQRVYNWVRTGSFSL